jgi:hypothetical protein
MPTRSIYKQNLMLGGDDREKDEIVTRPRMPRNDASSKKGRLRHDRPRARTYRAYEIKARIHRIKKGLWRGFPMSTDPSAAKTILG